MDTQYATLNIETITDNDVAKGVRFDNPHSQFAPDGMVKQITGSKPVDNTTTKNMKLQSYRLGKFMREFSKVGFEGLQEVKQKNGDTVWAMDSAIDNQDFNFYISKADIMSSITLTEVRSEEEIQEKATKYNIKPEPTYITIDGKKYFVHMDMPMHFCTGANSDTWINMGVFIVGTGVLAGAIAGVIMGLGFGAFKDALKNISSAVFKTLWAVFRGAMKACFRFVTRFIGSLITGESVDVALAAGIAGAGDAWEESYASITSTALKYTLVGLIIIAALMLFIEFALHESYQNVYFYNLTGYDIQIDFPYKDYGDYHNLPTKNVKTKIDRKGHGGIDLGEWYNGVAFCFQSDSEFHGLGYTMRFKLMNPKTQKVIKTSSCLFDVPWDGNNSLYCSIDEPSSYKDYYSKYSGEHKNMQYSAQDKEQEIIVTYDYLDGKHTDPETGNDMYLYASLVIIRDVVKNL